MRIRRKNLVRRCALARDYTCVGFGGKSILGLPNEILSNAPFLVRDAGIRDCGFQVFGRAGPKEEIRTAPRGHGAKRFWMRSAFGVGRLGVKSWAPGLRFCTALFV